MIDFRHGLITPNWHGFPNTCTGLAWLSTESLAAPGLRKNGTAATQLANQHLTIEVIAAFSRLADEPHDVAIDQRVNHPAEALDPDLRVSTLAVVDQRCCLPAGQDGVEDLASSAVPFADEVPSPLALQAPRDRRSNARRRTVRRVRRSCACPHATALD